MQIHAPDDTISTLLSIYQMTLKDIGDAVQDVPQSRMSEQPGGLVNHPAWTLAHLSAAAGFLLTLLDDRSVPTADAEFKQFGPGSTPSVDPKDFPQKAELLDRLAARHALVVAAVEEKHEDYFARPTPESLRAFAPTIGRIAVYLLASHESYHLGQLMQWRRAAGLASK
jgi:uncharacterized damage-inducible protein DinB